MPSLDLSRSRYPAISLQSAEVAVTKSDPKSVAYENRTKCPQSGGSEINGPREKISALSRRVAVGSFVREARGYWRFQRAKTRQRKFVEKEMAEREELETNILLLVNLTDERSGMRQRFKPSITVAYRAAYELVALTLDELFARVTMR